jgi:signal transduction histidine kinase
MADGIIEPSNEQLESLLSQVSNLSDLVSYLLDLSRLDADSTLLEKSVFGLEDFLLEAISPLKAYEGNKKLSFIVSVKPKNLKIEADRDRLQQIITNLAANAIKHSPPLSEIFLEGRRDGGQIVLSVIDSGIGIDKQDRKRVFKRFVQGKNASGGTGIGLAIVEWAVKLHGGSIEIKDSERGARFEVRLPSPQALHK